MKVISFVMKSIVGFSAAAFMFFAMLADSESALPVVAMIILAAIICMCLVAWKVMPRMLKPMKELRALIRSGVRVITIDYGRIPKEWHLVLNEELLDYGYRATAVSQNVYKYTV